MVSQNQSIYLKVFGLILHMLNRKIYVLYVKFFFYLRKRAILKVRNQKTFFNEPLFCF